jgi:hypothetical protein
MSIQEYSVSNRGLRSGLIGTPDQVSVRISEFEAAGVDLLLLQCSPQLEEMERFAAAVIQKEKSNRGEFRGGLAYVSSQSETESNSALAKGRRV